MTYQLDCPACHQRLYFPDFEERQEDFTEAVCTKCNYKYALFTLKVVAFTSNVETLHTNKYRKSPEYKRLYQLRLSNLDNTVKTIEFATRGQSSKLSALPEDEMLLLYTMRDKTLEDLIWVENVATAKSHLLLKSGHQHLILWSGCWCPDFSCQYSSGDWAARPN